MVDAARAWSADAATPGQEHNLEIMPVINKIDLPSAQPEHARKEIEEMIGLDCSDAPLISAKNGVNIEAVLEGIVEKIPPPGGDENAPLKALIFDSVYDSYKGVIVHIRVKDGMVKPGDTIRMMYTKKEFLVTEVGFFTWAVRLKQSYGRRSRLYCHEHQNVRDTRVGDTVTLAEIPPEPLLVIRYNPWCLRDYPADGAKYGDLRDALDDSTE